MDCDPDALKKIASRSRFFERATFSELPEEYLFTFSSNDVEVTFSYLIKERTTFLPGERLIKKFGFNFTGQALSASIAGGMVRESRRRKQLMLATSILRAKLIAVFFELDPSGKSLA